MEKSYEEKRENQEDIPVPSRRSQEEENLLEYLSLRSDVEKWYKKIRSAKRRIEVLQTESQAVAVLDKQLKKRPREVEEDRVSKKKKRAPAGITSLEKEAEEAKKKRIKNAKKRKIDNHRSYLRQGYTMTEKQIREEGGEVYTQYVYFKKNPDGTSSTHTQKGMEGLRLTSNLGNEEQEMLMTD